MAETFPPTLTEPLPLRHSWPLFERELRLDLGCLHGEDGCDPRLPAVLADGRVTAQAAIGLWECDLRDNAIRWSPAIYRIFGLPQQAPLSRAEALAFYVDESRATMECLRSYAIKHRRGFTIDASIRQAVGGGLTRMRITAAPLCEGGRVTRLQGIKQLLAGG